MTGLLTLVLLVVAANLILYHYFPAPPKPQSDRVYDVAIVLGSPTDAAFQAQRFFWNVRRKTPMRICCMQKHYVMHMHGSTSLL